MPDPSTTGAPSAALLEAERAADATAVLVVTPDRPWSRAGGGLVQGTTYEGRPEHADLRVGAAQVVDGDGHAGGAQARHAQATGDGEHPGGRRAVPFGLMHHALKKGTMFR